MSFARYENNVLLPTPATAQTSAAVFPELSYGAESRRLSILTAREIDDLYGRPRFTEDDCLLFFDLSPAEREAVDGVHTTSAAVHLVLQLGYFKVKRRFFVYEHAAVLDELHHGVERRRYFEPLYQFSHDFLTTTGLSSESVKYYASLIPFYTVYKLRRMALSPDQR